MRATFAGSIGLLTLGLAVSIAAARGCDDPPPHEDCDGAKIFSTDDLPYHDEGLTGCVNNMVDRPYYDIFYRYDCTVSGAHTLGMCDSDWDTYLRIYINGCGWSDGDEFAVNDDGCPGSSPPPADPKITVELEAGMSYWIELGTWRVDFPFAEPNDPFVFDVVLEPAACPGDTDGDGRVNVDDIVNVITDWGTDGSANGGDVTGALPGSPPDGLVDVNDLNAVIVAWGDCPR
jgi:hypothetical protein